MGLQGVVSPAHKSPIGHETVRAPQKGDATADDVARPKPFVERRRSKPIDHSWPEALECVQRHLMRFEEVNRQLEDAEKRYRELIERAPVGIFQTDADGKLLILNRAMAGIFGVESQETAERDGICLDALIRNLLGRWQEACASDAEVQSSAIETEIDCPDGALKWVRLHVKAVLQDGCFAGYEGAAEEITERKLLETRTEALAYYDLLSGLPNRTLLRESLARSLESARVSGNRVALLYLEIERFRAINESMGAAVGDRLLQEFAARIRTALKRMCWQRGWARPSSQLCCPQCRTARRRRLSPCRLWIRCRLSTPSWGTRSMWPAI